MLEFNEQKKYLSRGLYIFDKISDCKDCISYLRNAGIDEKLPIFKYEVYDKKVDYEKVYKLLSSAKILENKGMAFNLFLFFNDYSNFKPLNKLVKFFKFKKIFVRIYHCREIDFKLLATINKLDLSLNSVKISKKVNGNKRIYFDKSYFIKKDAINGCYICLINETIVPNCFSYKNYESCCDIIVRGAKVNVIKRYNYKKDLEIFKINVRNLQSTMQNIEIRFGRIFDLKGAKNIYYCLNKGKDKVEIYNGLTDKNFVLLGKFNNYESYKNYVCFSKTIKLKSFESLEFYFAVSCCKNIANYENINLENVFKNNNLDYLEIKTPNVVSKNKVLDYLINDYLISKIIENMVVNANCFDKDFLNLCNMNFDINLLDKSYTERKFNSYFLLQKDFFKAYFNLLYFYFGMWQDKIGININPDKSKLEDNCKVSLNFENKTLRFILKNKNLQNEIQLNNIKYTNLKHLNLLGDKFKGNMDLLY